MLDSVIGNTVGKFGQGLVIKTFLFLLLGMGAALAFLWFQNGSLHEKVGAKDFKIKSLEVDVATAKGTIKNVIVEIDHVDTVQETKGETIAEVETIIEYIDRETIKYETNTVYVKSTVPSEWVCVHDTAVSGLSNIHTTGGPEGKTIDFKNYNCTATQSTNIWEVMRVINENYGICLKEHAKYEALSELAFSFKERQAAYLEKYLNK